MNCDIKRFFGSYGCEYSFIITLTSNDDYNYKNSGQFIPSFNMIAKQHIILPVKSQGLQEGQRIFEKGPPLPMPQTVLWSPEFSCVGSQGPMGRLTSGSDKKAVMIIRATEVQRRHGMGDEFFSKILSHSWSPCDQILDHLKSVHTIQFFLPIIQPTFLDNNWMCERQFLTSFRQFNVLDENRTCSISIRLDQKNR